MDLVNHYGSSDEEDQQETVDTMSKSSIQINATPDAGFDVSMDVGDRSLLDRFPNTHIFRTTRLASTLHQQQQNLQSMYHMTT